MEEQNPNIAANDTTGAKVTAPADPTTMATATPIEDDSKSAKEAPVAPAPSESVTPAPTEITPTIVLSKSGGSKKTLIYVVIIVAALGYIAYAYLSR